MAFHFRKHFNHRKKGGAKHKYHMHLRFFRPSKSARRKTRVPRTSRSREFPLIRAMNLKSGSDNVPSALAHDLARYAKREDGAVREVTKPDHSKAYTVIAMSEQDMENSGLTTKSDSLADLSASMRKRLAYSASMIGDLDRGIVALAPTQNTLEVLHSFDEMKSIKYHWALFNRNVNDNDTNNKVQLLDNRVSLPELNRISKKGTKLYLRNNKIITDITGKRPPKVGSVPKSSNASASKPKSKPQRTAFGNVNTGNTTPTPNGGLNDGNTDGKSPFNNPKSASSGTAQDLTAFENSNVNNTSSNASHTSETGGDEDPFNTSGLNNQSSAPLESLGSSSASNSSENAFGNLNPDSDSGDTSSGSSMTSADKAFEEGASKIGWGYRTHGATRQGRYHEHKITKPTQSPATYSKQLNKFMGDTYNDSSLNLKIDLTDLKYLINRHPPLQFTLSAVKPDDELGRLINQRRTDLNRNLKTIHNHNMVNIYDWAMDTLGKNVALMNRALSPNNKTRIRQESMVYDTQYKVALSEASASYSNRAVSMEKAYNAQKSASVHQQINSLETRYDSVHNAALERSKRNLHSRLFNQAHDAYLQSNNKLQKERNDLAHSVIANIMPDLIGSVRDQVQQASAKEASTYDEYERQIIQLAQANYRKEASRKEAIAQAKTHDRKLVTAHREYNAMKERYRSEIRQKDRDAEQDRKAATAHADQVAHQTKVENKELSKRIATVRHDVAREYASRFAYQQRENKNLQHKNDAETHQREVQSNETDRELRAMNDRISKNRGYDIIYGCLIVIILGTAIGYASWNGARTKYYHAHTEKVQSNSSSSVPSQSAPPASSSSSAPSSSSSSSAPKPKPKKGNKKANTSLMMKRPSDKAGYYIATSTSHKPTSYTYVVARGNYQGHSAVKGIINNHNRTLIVEKSAKNRIVVKDPNNDRFYEFNK